MAYAAHCSLQHFNCPLHWLPLIASLGAQAARPVRPSLEPASDGLLRVVSEAAALRARARQARKTLAAVATRLT